MLLLTPGDLRISLPLPPFGSIFCENNNKDENEREIENKTLFTRLKSRVALQSERERESEGFRERVRERIPEGEGGMAKMGERV